MASNLKINSYQKVRSLVVCESWRETQFKIAHQAYDPFHHNPTHSSHSSSPWCAISRSTLFHWLWGCPATSSFWDQILKYIDKIYEIPIPKHPMLCVFGCDTPTASPPTSIPKNLPQWTHVCLLVVHRTIMQAWINPTPPQLTTAKQELWTLFLMEMLDTVTKHFKPIGCFITRWRRYMERSFSIEEISTYMKP